MLGVTLADGRRASPSPPRGRDLKGVHRTASVAPPRAGLERQRLRFPHLRCQRRFGSPDSRQTRPRRQSRPKTAPQLIARPVCTGCGWGSMGGRAHDNPHLVRAQRAGSHPGARAALDRAQSETAVRTAAAAARGRCAASWVGDRRTCGVTKPHGLLRGPLSQRRSTSHPTRVSVPRRQRSPRCRAAAASALSTTVGKTPQTTAVPTSRPPRP